MALIDSASDVSSSFAPGFATASRVERSPAEMRREVEAGAGRLTKRTEATADDELLADLDARRKPRPARHAEQEPRAAQPPVGHPHLGRRAERRRPRQGADVHDQFAHRTVTNARRGSVDRELEATAADVRAADVELDPGDARDAVKPTRHLHVVRDGFAGDVDENRHLPARQVRHSYFAV